MSCEHTEATLAWLYGEGDESHLAHVGGCAACQALVEEHESVLAAVQPALDVPVAAGPAPSGGEVVELAAWRRFAPLFALAAAALLALAVWSGVPGAPQGTDVAGTDPPVPEVAPGTDPLALEVDGLPNPTPAPVASLDPIERDLDAGLDDLDDAIEDLFADLETL